MTATVAILVAATFIPLGYVAWSAVSIGWTRAYELIVRPRVGELLFNTVALVVFTVPLCVVIGVGVAWLVERTDLPGRAFWRPLFVAPLAVPAFVNSYANAIDPQHAEELHVYLSGRASRGGES